ncbi:hypothetical protein NUW58_g10923 [Xylaria curta]|uniref:Uncharacterized protein n=1 Tax=Xylaria curta TaxID=42375 RepID=A0ACC1MG83_9PEZI|nr:hypothetical protein NUW58_g10923 [Xylaria curta]
MFVDSGGDAHLRNYSAKAQKVYNYIQRSGNPTDGIHLQVISREAPMPIQDAMAGAEELLSHGTIYTTVDDETYAILEHSDDTIVSGTTRAGRGDSGLCYERQRRRYLGIHDIRHVGQPEG